MIVEATVDEGYARRNFHDAPSVLLFQGEFIRVPGLPSVCSPGCGSMGEGTVRSRGHGFFVS